MTCYKYKTHINSHIHTSKHILIYTYYYVLLCFSFFLMSHTHTCTHTHARTRSYILTPIIHNIFTLFNATSANYREDIFLHTARFRVGFLFFLSVRCEFFFSCLKEPPAILRGSQLFVWLMDVPWARHSLFEIKYLFLGGFFIYIYFYQYTHTVIPVEIGTCLCSRIVSLLIFGFI